MNAHPQYMIERDRQDESKRQTIEIHKTFPQLNRLHMSGVLDGRSIVDGRDRIYLGPRLGDEVRE